ncbi:MAG: glycosyltransferase family 4 protein [Legionella sp.]
MHNKRILFVLNDLPFFISHRLPIAVAAKKEGYEVHVATPQGVFPDEIKHHGFIAHKIPLSRRGKNPIQEIKSIFALYILMRSVRPDLVHLVTIKPVLYGGIVSRMLKIPAVVAAVSGLGAIYISRTFRGKCLRVGINQLYRSALKHPNLKVIFQNHDDRQVLLEEKAFSLAQTVLIRGSGVNLSAYVSLPEPENEIVVAMISRLLTDKGVLEYVDAVTHLKSIGVQARFLLVGESDHGNPAFIDDAVLELWRREGNVELLGHRKDIPELMQQAHIIVLPSYREGLPKVLLEAAASGRAVITTDVPGCRDAIEKEQTGLLVPVRDAKALALAIQFLIENPDIRQQMGKAGRLLAEQEFSIEKVVSQHLALYQNLLTHESVAPCAMGL